MIENDMEEIFTKFRKNFYSHLFEKMTERGVELNTIELSSAETIFLLGSPTISAFAEFSQLSLPNANYRISQLETKGLIVKENSCYDKRESHLRVTDKFLSYYSWNYDYGAKMIEGIKKEFNEEEMVVITKLFDKIAHEILK